MIFLGSPQATLILSKRIVLAMMLRICYSLTTMEPKFSLKDSLFNRHKVEKIAAEIHAVYPAFDHAGFVSQTVATFPELELKARIVWIAETLTIFLPADFRQATTLLLDALPPACDPSLTDDDFGDFIYAPYSEYIVRHGCTCEDLSFSLQALKTITTRFSAEDAIRYFINAFPAETMTEIAKWARDDHYHVRRLASEGTRPKLPWSQKIVLKPGDAGYILDMLFFDRTRFVTRSVANHLNDISKTDPEFVLKKLAEWQALGQQSEKEMTYIVHHALRTLIKQGHEGAMAFLGFSAATQADVLSFEILGSKGHPSRPSGTDAGDSKGRSPLGNTRFCEATPSKIPEVCMGDAVSFSLEILAKKAERLLIDYVLYFQNKSGAMTNKKVYKLKQLSLQKDQRVSVEKRHPMRANMSTRQLYPGVHRIEIQINGQCVAGGEFRLVFA